MRRKTQIVLGNTFLVAALVCSGSYVYVSQALRQRVTTAHDTAAYLNSQLAYFAANAITTDLAERRVATSNPAKVRHAITRNLGANRDLTTMLESVVGTWPMIRCGNSGRRR
jgi:uncharacterized membrane protein